MADVYDVGAYGRMIADRTRTEAYARALEAAVRPGSVVLDIGCGTGLFALLACRLGARRVYAVEPGDAVQVARELARANGMDDRIVFFQDLSTRLDLPERADVVVADLRGALPFFGRVAESFADARRRLLAPGGVLIPRADTFRAAPVEAEEAYRRIVGPWEEGHFGLDAGAARRRVVNAWTRERFDADQLLAEPQVWTTLDYRTIEEPDARGTLSWTAARDGVAHGFALWFDAELGDGIGYSTAPGGPPTIYGTAFFPWPRPVALREGDRVRVALEARLVSGDYVWRWETSIEGESTEAYRQSTFLAAPLTPARLRRRAQDFRPALGEEGRIDRMALERMDGGASLGEIARALHAAFPARFATWEAALTRVAELSDAYARAPEDPPA